MERFRTSYGYEVVTRIVIVDYDERWPEAYRIEAERIQAMLGPRVLAIEHTGSTSVPGLSAKPVIDILLVVADSAAEGTYAPDLENAGYVLTIREPEWYQHRLFKRSEGGVNLHVLSEGCLEIDRMLLFRDWLRGNKIDRDLYANTKLRLAQQAWPSVE
jgi:GrpB-like predicted nucleotidyltransferase (UPF0157 family)